MGCKKTILIVEDEELIRETLCFALELEGYRVIGAGNGKEAIDLLPNLPRPCLILLDLMMPVMDGWGFMTALQEKNDLKQIPVVIVTAFAEKAKTVSSDGIIIKPINLDVLSKTVKKYCA